MRKTCSWMVLAALLLLPKEAIVSQIHVMETDAQPLKEYLQNGWADQDHILLVKGPIKNALFREVVFPRETHYEKKEITEYKEHVYQYVVEKVLRSPEFKPGDTFWVWEEPAYGYEAMRLYHEQGLLESPIVLEEKSNYPIKGDQRVVFLSETGLENADYPRTYQIRKKEGAGAVQELETLLGKKRKAWWRFW